jgi:hypothetical protein
MMAADLLGNLEGVELSAALLAEQTDGEDLTEVTDITLRLGAALRSRQQHCASHGAPQ